MTGVLNNRACQLAERLLSKAGELKVIPHALENGAIVVDCGIETPAGIQAGLMLARICMSDLADVQLIPGTLEGQSTPYLQVQTDHAVESCLLSQYAGWKIDVDNYFAMGSGPMRAAAEKEDLYRILAFGESPEKTVGVLEADSLPGVNVVEMISKATGVEPKNIILLVAPTSSIAGNIQVISRSVETALHKLFECDFDVHRIQAGYGTAPLAPVAKDSLSGIGRTNDSILYGGAVTLWVTGDDESLLEIGPSIPSNSAACFGKPFLEVFKEANHDFYEIDPSFFSPAVISFQNLDTGNVFQFGEMNTSLLKNSFGF
ncbi:MAG: methenyltetrahydromethanopterin cyclohydrolase [Planctomycetes bacterium]|nr:methenyltetrahydromethanopterin cyclohydrolase [Planctomycetota bacterium]MCH9728022.1 methenyltetrahydromethanopterin cyclohydrolase [Planctomycetota bacterium]MCH9775824.1 methenyltetrahydromethanopterin cyclohydrolase [Planctomycetota bacterium]MCH9793501.1 methenyltetrahydromethanopterin cyclohydrolase [Planctomycetota bacterium]MDF1744672.1 methenyltetrahydromethanopterin cyclohydrolase [Gimesia sp.]